MDDSTCLTIPIKTPSVIAGAYETTDGIGAGLRATAVLHIALVYVIASNPVSIESIVGRAGTDERPKSIGTGLGAAPVICGTFIDVITGRVTQGGIVASSMSRSRRTGITDII